jgi:hypothetical protein
MKYFDSLPLITNLDNNNNIYALRNLMVRTELMPSLITNPLLFYQYEIREGDTPEIIAKKYYGDSYRYWLVLYGNPERMNPQFDWPLTSKQFEQFLINKYSVAAGGDNLVMSYITSTVHHYEKVITTYDNESQTTVIKNVEVDFETYNLIEEVTTTNTFADNSSLKYSVTAKAVSIYDYENGLNESKRNINLINSSYINKIETQYQTLVKS